MADQFEQLSLFNEQESDTKPVVNNDEIIDLDLSATKKKKFRFDHDDNRIVELNISDMNIIQRISEVTPKLTALQEKASKITEGLDLETPDENFETASIIAERLKAVDQEMRDLIDYLFNADVSSKAAPDGSMYDPFEGSFRYEYIIIVLIQQYGDNINAEYQKIEKQISKYTNKYKK